MRKKGEVRERVEGRRGENKEAEWGGGYVLNLRGGRRNGWWEKVISKGGRERGSGLGEQEEVKGEEEIERRLVSEKAKERERNESWRKRGGGGEV